MKFSTPRFPRSLMLKLEMQKYRKFWFDKITEFLRYC